MVLFTQNDDALCRDELYGILNEYRTEHRLQIDIHKFYNAASLLSSPQRFDMIILDYQMPGSNRMDAARVLWQRRLTCSIVFASRYPHFVMESFDGAVRNIPLLPSLSKVMS